MADIFRAESANKTSNSFPRRILSTKQMVWTEAKSVRLLKQILSRIERD